MKESSLTPGGPDNVETRAKKAHVRESAEVIVVRAPTHEGPNVKVIRIAVSKEGRI